MNVEECAALVAMVRSLYPAQRFDDNPENVVKAWGYVVRDLDYTEAQAAVVRLARRSTPWVSPGEIRQECARARNVLSPDVDQLLADVREVASHDGVGRLLLHPAARTAYDSIGGAQAVRRLDSRGLQSLRRQIEQQAEKHDARVLEESELPPARPALPPISSDVARLMGVQSSGELPSGVVKAKTADELRRMSESFGKVDP